MEEHPDWADLPITICKEDGELDYIGDEYEKGGVREDEDGMEFNDDGEPVDGTGEKVLVFWS
jgi:hypothetical protein